MPVEIGLLDIPRGWAARGSLVQDETVSSMLVLVKNPEKGYAPIQTLDFRHRSSDSRHLTSDTGVLEKGHGVSCFAFGLMSEV
jgi:hypothetical protein